jgi:hypothetical protein
MNGPLIFMDEQFCVRRGLGSRFSPGLAAPWLGAFIQKE